MHRTHTCGELRKEQLGEVVTLAGRVHNKRDMGGLVFIDLRDRYGITQLHFDPKTVVTEMQAEDFHATTCGPAKRRVQEIIDELKYEYCIKVTGIVQERPVGQINEQMSTGAVEVEIQDVEILSASKTLPFQIVDDPKTSEEQRMKYRFLDLRRKQILKNIEFRATMNHFTRNRFTAAGFLEVQTPIFTVSSPEGSRDYLIPSRVNPGKFYAMPQAPQQYKQLLMIGGIDRYFQIAPCFRDEDPRADRAMCEFYQVDLEMSFVEQQDVLAVLQAYALEAVQTLVPHKRLKFGNEFPRISYYDAMNRYGIDRPDLRFGMEIVDVSEEVRTSEFGVFRNTIAEGGVVRGIKVEGHLMSRKEIDEVTDVARHMGAGGLAYLAFESGEVKGPIAKFMSEEELKVLTTKFEAKEGDMIFFAAGKRSLVCKVLDKVRIFFRDKYNLVDKDELAFCFVVDFPFYEHDEDKDTWDFGHNPFSEVVGGIEALQNKPIAEIMTHQYDIVLNGREIGGGSIRNHEPEVLIKAFEKVGYKEEDIKKRFGTMYEALQYGAPPHGGCAFGFDRFMMVMCDEPNIREVYAFPKSGKAEDVMMGAPGEVDEKQLEELHIEVRKEKSE